MQCLSLLEKDVVATGLLKKMKNVRFGTSLFILKEMLPILANINSKKPNLSFSLVSWTNVVITFSVKLVSVRASFAS
jgi:hypothetical protein